MENIIIYIFKDGNAIQAGIIWALIGPNFRNLHSKLESPLTFNAMTSYFLLYEINQGYNKGWHILQD